MIDLFRTSDTSLENNMLLPLGTAQELFGFQGELTSIFVTVNREQNVEQAVAKIREILGSI